MECLKDEVARKHWRSSLSWSVRISWQCRYWVKRSDIMKCIALQHVVAVRLEKECKLVAKNRAQLDAISAVFHLTVRSPPVRIENKQTSQTNIRTCSPRFRVVVTLEGIPWHLPGFIWTLKLARSNYWILIRLRVYNLIKGRFKHQSPIQSNLIGLLGLAANYPLGGFSRRKKALSNGRFLGPS